MRRSVIFAALAWVGCANASAPPTPSPAPTATAAVVASTMIGEAGEGTLSTISLDQPLPPQPEAAPSASTALIEPPATSASAPRATTNCPRRNLRTKRDSWLSAGGHTMFDAHCGNCHPNADAGEGPRLDGLRWSRACMRRLIESGHGGRLGTRPIPASGIDHMMDWLEYARAVE